MVLTFYSQRTRLVSVVLLLVTCPVIATGAGPPDMTGLFAVLLVVVAIIPLLLLEWAIVRAKKGKTAWYLTLPAIGLLLLLAVTFIGAIYQGHFLNIDGASIVVFLAWTAFRMATFLKRLGKHPAPDSEQL